MIDKPYDVDYLIASELDTLESTSVFYPQAEYIVRRYINIFFKLHYYMKDDFKDDSDDHVFHAFTYYTYLRLPYNIKSIYNSCIQGYYLESIILLRHVVEGLAQVKYFHNHREELNPHLLATRSKERIQFRTMFEEVVPGFYDFIYGKFFSRFSHGHLVTSLFRAKYETREKGNLIYGCQFIDNYCKLILEQLFTYCYGFLNHFEVFFPKFSKSADQLMINEYQTTVSEIREIILAPRSTQEFQDGFEKYLLPFIENK